MNTDNIDIIKDNLDEPDYIDFTEDSAGNSDDDFKKRGQFKSVMYRFGKNKLAVIGLIVFVFMLIIAASADLIVNYEEQVIKMDVRIRLEPPSSEHLFGTDQFGRDIFARIIHGSRISLFVGLITIVFSLAVGAVIGSVAGYYGGWVDNVLMRITDVLLAIPSILLAISIVAALGIGIVNLLIAMSISQIPRFARIVRASIMSIRSMDFIEACKACGTKNARIIFIHILPNAIGPIIVQTTLSMAAAILTISSLSFVGLGVPPPAPEWGSMLSDGREMIRTNPNLVVIPGMFIIFAVLALNVIGDGLRDALDPRLKN